MKKNWPGVQYEYVWHDWGLLQMYNFTIQYADSHLMQQLVPDNEKELASCTVCVAGSEPVANLQFYYPVYGLPPYITLLPDHEKELARFYMILTIQYADCHLLLQLLPVHE